MPNTDPLTDDRRNAGRQARRGARGGCIATSPSSSAATADNIEQLAELERLPGCAGVKVFMGSSTGGLLVADDAGVVRSAGGHPPPRRVPCRGRVAPERAQAPAPSRATRVHIPYGATPRAALTRDEAAGRARARDRRAHARAARLDRGGDGLLAGHKDVASVEVTPQHLTLEAPDCYERLGTHAQMNPPMRDAAHRAGIWARRCAGRGRYPGLRSRSAHARGKGAALSRKSPSGMTGVQTLVPHHARPRQRRPDDP